MARPFERAERMERTKACRPVTNWKGDARHGRARHGGTTALPLRATRGTQAKAADSEPHAPKREEALPKWDRRPEGR